MKSTIGVTGPIASGKGVVADRLKPKGYIHVSLSDEVRKEARRRGLPEEREVLQNVGDSLRLEFGNNILAQRIAESIDELRQQGQAQRVLIDGLRNPGEIQWLKEHYGMYTIGVTADEETRIERAVSRARASDPTTDTEAIRRAMQRDRGIGQAEHGNNVDACVALADKVIENNGTFEELDGKLQEILLGLGIEGNPQTKEGKF